MTKFGVFVITGVNVKFSMFFAVEKMSLFFRCGFCFHDFLLPVFKECLETFLFNMTKSFLLRKTAICISLEYNGRNGKLSSARVDSIILGAPGQLTGKGLGWSPRKFYLHCKTPLEEKNELSEKTKNKNNNN